MGIVWAAMCWRVTVLGCAREKVLAVLGCAQSTICARGLSTSCAQSTRASHTEGVVILLENIVLSLLQRGSSAYDDRSERLSAEKFL